MPSHKLPFVYSFTRCVSQNTLNHNALKSANRIEAILVAFYVGGPKESSLARLAFTGVLKANFRSLVPACGTQRRAADAIRYYRQTKSAV